MYMKCQGVYGTQINIYNNVKSLKSIINNQVEIMIDQYSKRLKEN